MPSSSIPKYLALSLLGGMTIDWVVKKYAFGYSSSESLTNYKQRAEILNKSSTSLYNLQDMKVYDLNPRRDYYREAIKENSIVLRKRSEAIQNRFKVIEQEIHNIKSDFNQLQAIFLNHTSKSNK